MKRFLLALLLMISAVSVPVFAAAGTEPDTLVRNLTEEVLEILRTDEKLRNGDTQRAVELIEKAVLPHFNLRRMTMLAVGRDWRNATPQQHERLTEAFYHMLVRTYSNALTEYRDQDVRFRPLRMAPDDRTVRVQTEIVQPSGGQPISVDYVLDKDGDAWKIFDVVIAGVSLVTNYRSTFAQEVRAGGIDGLINTLETRSIEVAQPAKP